MKRKPHCPSYAARGSDPDRVRDDLDVVPLALEHERRRETRDPRAEHRDAHHATSCDGMRAECPMLHHVATANARKAAAASASNAADQPYRWARVPSTMPPSDAPT